MKYFRATKWQKRALINYAKKINHLYDRTMVWNNEYLCISLSRFEEQKLISDLFYFNSKEPFNIIDLIQSMAKFKNHKYKNLKKLKYNNLVNFSVVEMKQLVEFL